MAIRNRSRKAGSVYGLWMSFIMGWSIAILFYSWQKSYCFLGNKLPATVKSEDFQLFYLLFDLPQPMLGLLYIAILGEEQIKE